MFEPPHLNEYRHGSGEQVVEPHGPTEANRALIRRLVDDVFIGRQDNGLEAYFSDELVIRSPIAAEPLHGVAGYRHFSELYRRAFPDLRPLPEFLMADGDKVAVRFTWRGTNSGSYLGHPATGRLVAWSGMNTFVIRDGRIVSLIVDDDELGLLRQLGVVDERLDLPKAG